MTHVSEKKKEIVKRLVDEIKSHKVIGIVSLDNLPAPQLQQMRNKLRESAVIIGCKKRLAKVAFEQTKQQFRGIENLEEHMDGMIALIFTNENPFRLASTLRKNRTNAPAKAGQVAPKDIVVKAGATPFAPGPIIGELGSLGIKTGVENGKVSIKEDKVVLKQGEVIKRKVAELLTRLDIKPMEIGLDLKAAYDEGVIFTKDVLDVDENYYIDALKNEARRCHLLALDLGYACKETISSLIGKAYQQAEGLALLEGIFVPELIRKIIARAEASAHALAAKVS